MIKKLYLLACLLFTVSLGAHEVAFQEATIQEIDQIQDESVQYYSEQLLEAGLVNNVEEAVAAAIAERELGNKNIHYYQLISKNSPSRYGYIFYSISDQEAYLEWIYLNPEYRGQGIGRLALQELEREVKRKGVEVIRLYVFAHNPAAIALYSKMGYKVETAYSDGNRPIGQRMKKDILQ